MRLPIVDAQPPTRRAHTLLVLLVMSLCAWLGVYQQTPPAARGADAPAHEFSSARALKHLELIAAEPHPSGSAAHKRVRDYLLNELSSLGLDAQVQEALAVNPRLAPLYAAARVQNVVALQRGSETGKAVMLAAHYDSVASSFGASDDGAAVAAILETVRALKAGSPLKRDLIVLFTDAEEDGLLGARAFVDEHPWAKNIGLVLNFEARGNGGPSYMFETSGDNARLVEELARAAPHVEANSLAREIYKLLPNDTDFSEFKRGGIAGMNFAYIGGITYYHTRLDTTANMDQGSLQHHGLYALSLARHFGNLGSEYGGSSEAVYFKPLNGFFVSYSRMWVIPLTLLTAALLITVVVLGFRQKLFTASGIIFGFLAQLLTAAIAWGVATVLWLALRGKVGGWMYNAHLFAIGFVVLTLGLFVALHILFRRKIRPHTLAAGAMLLWLVLLTAVTIYMPGASYLFAWPLLLGTLALAAVISDTRERPTWLYVVLMLCAAPTLLLWSQTLYQIYQAMTLNVIGPLMAVVALVCGLLLPQFGLLSRRQLWLIPATGTLLCIAFLVAGISSSKFDKERPKMNSIFYVMNADTTQAVWASVDEVPDEWTSQYLVGNTVKGSLVDYLPLNYRGFTIASAPSSSLEAPEAVLLDDVTTDGARTLRLHIRSRRRAPFVTVDVGPGTEIRRALLDDKPLAGTPSEPRRDADIGWALRYHAVGDDGFKLTLETAAGRPLKIRVTDRSAGLPQLPSVKNIPRPEHMMSAPYPYSDTTSISKSFTF